MGIQLTSETTYATLLPGLTNLTQRYRYYSFYCWLLNEFIQKGQLTDDNSHYLSFLRKGEYLIALCSQAQFHKGESIKGISGSDYAGRVLSETTQSVNLEAGIYKEDKSTAGTYWKGTYGILATYYSGAMKSLSIINDNNFFSLVNTTEKTNDKINGLKLANAFDQNLELNAKQIFLDCIEKGEASIDELSQISTSFNLSVIPDGTEEQRLLLELITDQDKPLYKESNYFRRQTIKLMLEYIQQEELFYDRAFLDHIYFGDTVFQDLNNITLKGWYFYLFNEFWLFANTSILNALLIDLARYQEGWVPTSDIVNKNVNTICNSLGITQEMTLEDVLVLDILIEKNERQLADEIEQQNDRENSVAALLLILKLYKTNHDQLKLMNEFGQQYSLNREGNGLVYFIEELSNQKSQKFTSWCKNFINKRIIQRHQLVALRKMGLGSLTTQKFLLEDQHMRYIDNFSPFFSGPRLRVMHLFLEDLNLVEKEKLTTKGLQLLNNLM